MGGPRGAHAELARGPQGAHSGDTRGTHLGPSMDPSGPNTGSPYGPQVGPMRVARMATYGRLTWGPRRIGQGGTRGHFGNHLGLTVDPSGAHTGSPYGPQVGPMRVARRATYGRPTWGPRRIAHGGPQGAYSGDTRGTHMGPTMDPSGPTGAAHAGHRRAP